MTDLDGVLVINMQEGRMWGDCAMCGQYKRLDHAVSWDCGPVHYETDGGMVVCRECHDWHYTDALAKGGE